MREMSDRLISEEKLAEILGEQWCDECMTDDCYYCNIYQIKEIIRNMPTVDDVRHGHWIGESQTKFEKLVFSSRVFKCSVCGNYLDFDGVNVGRGSANYCPNCGAKMGEVTEDA